MIGRTAFTTASACGSSCGAAAFNELSKSPDTPNDMPLVCEHAEVLLEEWFAFCRSTCPKVSVEDGREADQTSEDLPEPADPGLGESEAIGGGVDAKAEADITAFAAACAPRGASSGGSGLDRRGCGVRCISARLVQQEHTRRPLRCVQGRQIGKMN
mmetsp:Transcript_49963/g.87949  ORF Transcript_49963/g.87949 Transcript_49963/m.87949 type:complete len:157 (+) Transcript_49963:339-809(+)